MKFDVLKALSVGGIGASRGIEEHPRHNRRSSNICGMWKTNNVWQVVKKVDCMNEYIVRHSLPFEHGDSLLSPKQVPGKVSFANPQTTERMPSSGSDRQSSQVISTASSVVMNF